ncbi:hypothetical protein EYF80_024575 [Liparis tanakae]|uniref:Uncharacterized protein n=1 Tax=Liparis tanakae TaxID=230148 RepID=A0A4Z2HH32_9TELE|nr:hypothetical protein EYF80_024575 [Liparis tanakae]
MFCRGVNQTDRNTHVWSAVPQTQRDKDDAAPHETGGRRGQNRECHDDERRRRKSCEDGEGGK